MFIRILSALILSTFIAFRGYNKKSLSTSGCVSGWITGFLTCICGYRKAAALIIFFITSSALTKYKAERKRRIEEEYKEGGQRNWVQVVSNSGTATILGLIYYYLHGTEEILIDTQAAFWPSVLLVMILGHYACCNGDTWASELGILSNGNPRLITNWRIVPRGTNGGISVFGTTASVIGGLTIGLTFWLCGLLFASPVGNTTPSQWPIIFVGAAAGFVGSMIDSLMGATLQYSGWSEVSKKVSNNPSPALKHISGQDILDNHQVNFLSSLATSVVFGLLTPLIF